jgi:hypothetical protein
MALVAEALAVRLAELLVLVEQEPVATSSLRSLYKDETLGFN